MKGYRPLAIASLAICLAVVLLLNSGRTAHPVQASGGACPASLFVGLYGLTGDGFNGAGIRASQPVATGGEMIVSPDQAPAQLTGTISGHATINDGRSITRVTLSGTYRMTGTDCTGSAVVSASNGTIRHYDLALTQWVNQGHANWVFFVETDPGSVETLTLVDA